MRDGKWGRMEENRDKKTRKKMGKIGRCMRSIKAFWIEFPVTLVY
jgi:hypothetical protein